MATTKDKIRRWLERGIAEGATHVIVATDTFDYGDYPVNVMPGDDPRERAEELRNEKMTKVMEVYSLRMDIEDQLNEPRAFHYG